MIRSQGSSQPAGAANKRAHSKACQVCPADTNSLTRQCGTYRHPTAHAILGLRHVYAIHNIALAIKQGASGGADLFMDTEGHQRSPRDADAVPALSNLALLPHAFEA